MFLVSTTRIIPGRAVPSFLSGRYSAVKVRKKLYVTSIEVRHRPQEMDKLTEGTSQHLTTLTRSQLEKDKVPSQHVMETKRQLCPRSASTSTLQTQLAQPHSNGQDSKPSGCSEKGQSCPLGATWKTCAEELPCGPFFGSRRTGPLAFVGSIIWMKSR